MIVIPDNAHTYRMLTIDNGSNTLGLSIVDLHLQNKSLTVKYSETCTATKTMDRYRHIADNYGDRFARYRVLGDFVNEMLEHFDPDVVCIETPFMHRHPSAYAVLREALMMITDTVANYDYRLEIIGVTPMEAKRAVGAAKYDKGKEPVRQAVLALNDVYYAAEIEPRHLDEHCIDSIAVAYYHATEVLKSIHRE